VNALAAASATVWSCSPELPLTPTAPTTRPSSRSGIPPANHDPPLAGRMDPVELPAGLGVVGEILGGAVERAGRERLCSNSDAVAFVKAFVATGKPITSICHGPWTLLEADAVRGRRLTSWPSLWTDLRHAGAEVLDQEVVIDGQLTTSRSPAGILRCDRQAVRPGPPVDARLSDRWRRSLARPGPFLSARPAASCVYLT
jgi:hypothetical protein